MFRNTLRALGKYPIMSRRTSCEVIPPLQCGQPTHESHPSLLKYGEITPHIHRCEFQTRRECLAHAIKDARGVPHNLIIIPSAVKRYMSDKIPYVFRQNTDYMYLTGNTEPDSCLAITTDENDTISSILFVRTPDPHSEQWDGPRTDPRTAVCFFGVEQSLPMCEFEKFMRFYLKSYKNCMVWYDFLDPVQPCINKSMCEFLYKRMFEKCDSPTSYVQRLRVIKSPAEIELMKKSCDIASEAISDAMKCTKEGQTEHQVFARIDYECRVRGADYLAYPPVVAGGDRATIIHYINNNQILCNQDLLLVDAGCEYHGYCSDITRTWPISGKFTCHQTVLYEIVLHIQEELLKLLCTFPTLDCLYAKMIESLGKELKAAGIISSQTSNEHVRKLTQSFCPHHVAHYLGMDVHDTPKVPRNLPLQPGMIITIEPGLYITNKHRVDPEYQGMGVRIEDDVLITKNGPVVLTEKCPKQYCDVQGMAYS